MTALPPQYPQGRALGSKGSSPASKRKWLKPALIVSAVVLLIGIGFAWKAGFVLNKISSKDGGIFSSLIKSLPGVANELKGEKDGRINILLLGMRGEHMEGGGLLSDTIMVLSIHPPQKEGDQPKASLVSIPRDLYVTVPGTSDKAKINAVHAYGEQKGQGQGNEAMKEIISEVTGQPIHYVVSISFKGFTDLVDALGGVDVTLKEPFNESVQFRQPHVCDPYVFTEPAIDPVTKKQMVERKYHKKLGSVSGLKRVAKEYPLCYNKDVECGGVFELPAGVNHLDGGKALCYARARYTSSDFERAKRQQAVIQAIREKALSVGTLADFSKVNGILNALGDNVRTDMQPWEMKRFFEMYPKMQSVQPSQKVLDNTEEGLLYNPPETKETGYILLPIGDNYDRIKELFKTLP